MSPKVPTVKLSSNFDIPIIGLGTWKSKPGEVYDAVYAAIELGYRHLDCALAYSNENEVGEAIAKAISNGLVKREDLFVTTKAWNTYHSRAKVLECCKKSLASLKLDYVDLYLIHWPMGYKEGDELFPRTEAGEFLFSDVDYLETWQGMEDCFSKKLVRSVGLSNFNEKQIQRILDHCTVRPVVNQVECHPYLNQNALIEFCNKKDIKVTAYSPLGSPDRPMKDESDPPILEEPKIGAIAARLNKSVAQVLIRFQVQRGIIVIPKSVTKKRIAENFNVFDFELSTEDMQTIGNIGINCRYLPLSFVKHHPHHPFPA